MNRDCAHSHMLNCQVRQKEQSGLNPRTHCATREHNPHAYPPLQDHTYAHFLLHTSNFNTKMVDPLQHMKPVQKVLGLIKKNIKCKTSILLNIIPSKNAHFCINTTIPLRISFFRQFHTWFEGIWSTCSTFFLHFHILLNKLSFMKTGKCPERQGCKVPVEHQSIFCKELLICNALCAHMYHHEESNCAPAKTLVLSPSFSKTQ